MRRALFLALLATAACSGPTSTDNDAAATEAVASHAYLTAQRAKVARIEMAPRTDFLTDEERQVVNLLIEASDMMNPIYLRQVAVDNPETRAAIDAAKGRSEEHTSELQSLM